MVSGPNRDNHVRPTSERAFNGVPARDGGLSGRGRRGSGTRGGTRTSSQGRGNRTSFFAAATSVSELPDMGLLTLGRDQGTPSAQPQQTRDTIRAERINRMNNQRAATAARQRERVQQAATARYVRYAACDNRRHWFLPRCSNHCLAQRGWLRNSVEQAGCILLYSCCASCSAVAVQRADISNLCTSSHGTRAEALNAKRTDMARDYSSSVLLM